MSKESLDRILDNWLATNDLDVPTKYARTEQSTIVPGELVINAGRAVKINGQVISAADSFHTHALTESDLETLNRDGDDNVLKPLLTGIDRKFLEKLRNT